jgi:hypothetical protein
MVESSNILGTTTTITSSTMMMSNVGHRLLKFVYTWVIRFGSVSVGLVLIAGTVLYMQQDNLLVRKHLDDFVYDYARVKQ